jgi:hypothetical protein
MAWMTCTISKEFLKTLSARTVAKNRNLLLFTDNCTVHPKNAAHLSNVHVEFMPPNMTSVVLLKDQGMIRVFKLHF